MVGCLRRTRSSGINGTSRVNENLRRSAGCYCTAPAASTRHSLMRVATVLYRRAAGSLLHWPTSLFIWNLHGQDSAKFAVIIRRVFDSAPFELAFERTILRQTDSDILSRASLFGQSSPLALERETASSAKHARSASVSISLIMVDIYPVSDSVRHGHSTAYIDASIRNTGE
jgi:hypothetical protein